MSRLSFDRSAWGPTPAPRDDELLSSWLARVAASHGQSSQRFAVDRLGTRAFLMDIDRRPGSRILENILAAGRVSAARIQAMTLSEWEPRLGSRRPRAGVTPWVLARGLSSRARFRHGLQACIYCLAEGSGFRRQWRLAFVVVCDRHATWLIDACPACDEPLRSDRLADASLGCSACRRRFADYRYESGPFFSAATQLQGWLVDALERDASVRIGDATITLANALTGFRFLARLEHRRRGGADRLERVEFMRHSERLTYLDRVATFLSCWPDAALEQARRANMSRSPFPGEACPSWVLSPFSNLRAPRPRKTVPVIEDDAMLEHLRRSRPAGWRSRYAHRLAELVGKLS